MKKLNVYLNFSALEKRLVGQLAESKGRVYFEYAPEFLTKPLWLSPFKLKPTAGLIEHVDRQFGPLFGLFDESLPDGWGRLLMDRHFSRLGRALQAISPLYRLAYLGSRTMGALTYEPPLDDDGGETAQLLDLQQLAKATQSVAHRPCFSSATRLPPHADRS